MRELSPTALIYLLASWLALGLSQWVIARFFPHWLHLALLYRDWLSVLVTALLLNRSLLRQNSRRDAVERELRRMAIYDPLTGLLNRAAFVAGLEKAIALARRNGTRLGVIFIDLDRFKEVNDRHGHHVGDHVLVEAAKRLQAITRSADSVARWGGDEFVLLVDCAGEGGAQAAARRVLQALREPTIVHGLALDVTASVGLAEFPDHGDEAEHLIRAADTAMYQVKAAGRNAVLEMPPG